MHTSFGRFLAIVGASAPAIGSPRAGQPRRNPPVVLCRRSLRHPRHVATVAPPLPSLPQTYETDKHRTPLVSVELRGAEE
jgi:hypothetical protein